MGADTSKAKWDEENEVYRFLDLTYEVKNERNTQTSGNGSTGHNLRHCGSSDNDCAHTSLPVCKKQTEKTENFIN